MNQNWQKNRSMKRLPRKPHTFSIAIHISCDDAPIAPTADGSRVYITRDKLHSDYICASYVDVRMNKLY